MASRIWNCAVWMTYLCAFLVEHGACDAPTCEKAQLSSCLTEGVEKVRLKIPSFTGDSLKKDCKNVDVISTCVNNLKMDGCQEEERRQLQFLKDGLRSTRNSLCHENLHQSMDEWNRCLNKAMLAECIREYKYERNTLEVTGHLSRDERECRVLESVDSCTKYMETGGCSDESKQRLQYLKSDFASLRSHICDPNLHTSTLEWNQCLDKSAMESCSKLLPHDHCSYGFYNCFLNATAKCTRDSPAMKAVHDSFNTHLDLKNCRRVEWNSGIITSPKIC